MESCKVILGNIINEIVNEQNGNKMKRIFNGIFRSPEAIIKIIAEFSLIYNKQEKTKVRTEEKVQ